MTQTWKNWGRTEQCTPSRVASPLNVTEVAQLVAHARDTGGAVRAVGASHSFSGAAVASGTQLNLNQLRGIQAVDLARNEVTLWAGTYIWEIPKLLRPLGLALANMGDIDRQTIAGAISTGTHGTGSRYGGLSSQVVGLEMVTGTAEVLRIDRHNNAELLGGAALSVGSLGVIVTVTLQCVPEYFLHAREAAQPLETVLRDFESLNTEADHFEFYWFPHTTVARTKLNTRLPVPGTGMPQTELQRFLDHELANNVSLGAVVKAQRMLPQLTPHVNRYISSLSSDREYTDLWHRVYVTRRRVRFREMEYALPREVIPEVLRELRQCIDRRRFRVSFPVEVRTAAADQLWLSTAYQRETGYIAVHRYWRESDTEYFAAAEEICVAAGGRPHWGKQHTLQRGDLEAVYPAFAEFVSLRDRFDPERVFRNPYTQRVFGE